MNYKEFMDKQCTLRGNLTLIMNRDKLTFKRLSKDIGIALNTLFCFLREEKPVQFRTLSKISDYVIKHEEK